MKTIESFSLYIISLENNIPTIGLFWRWRATTVTRPRDTHVANDLSVSSQNSIEIHSRDIVFCRLEADNCTHFLLGRKLNSSCRPMFVLFWNFFDLFCLSSILFCRVFFFISIFFLPEGQDKIYLSHSVTARALSLKIWVFIFIANTQQRVETKNMLNKSLS